MIFLVLQRVKVAEQVFFSFIQSQFDSDIIPMERNCRNGYVQQVCNFLASLSLFDQFYDVHFGWGKAMCR